MGKGDSRSKKGKRVRGSFGKTRNRRLIAARRKRKIENSQKDCTKKDKGK